MSPSNSQTRITSPKPRSENIHSQLTRLPKLTIWRRLARRAIRLLLRLLAFLLIQADVRGLEDLPNEGPLLGVTNHLGDADVALGIVISDRPLDMLAKVELYDIPVLGKLLDAYGVIWVHRGQPDRRAIRAALGALSEGRFLGIAPEGRESLTGALEEGTGGAAYLALKSSVPVIPVTFTGTENARVYGNMKRLRRTQVTITVGAPFYLEPYPDLQTAIDLGTQKIMQILAKQLPAEYQGVYKQKTDKFHGSESA